MRILVSGATGFIGRHLTAALLDQGDHVCALVRHTSNTTVLPAGVETLIGDVTNQKSLTAAVAGADIVFHLAALLRAPWRRDFVGANAGGTENMAKACAGVVPRLIIVSSLAAGGPVALGRIRDEWMPPVPVSQYGRTKLAGERAARRFADELSISIARPPIVIGEFDRNSLGLFRAAAHGIAVTPTREPAPVTVIHAADLAQALMRIASKGELATAENGDDQSGVYYTPGAPALDMIELGQRIGQAMDIKVRGFRLPKRVTWLAAAATEAVGRLTNTPQFFGLDKYREATGGSWACSGQKLAEIGFSPMPLQARLEQTASWYQSQGLL